MAVGNSGVSVRTRLNFAAPWLVAVAIVAFVCMVFGSRIDGTTTSLTSIAPTTASAKPSAAGAASTVETIAKAKGMTASMASYFELNQGQTDPRVKYLSRSGRYSMFLTDDATTVISMVGGQLHKGPAFAMSNPPPKPDADRLIESDVRIRLVGANRHPTVTGLEPLPGRVNYLIGDDSTKWHRNIPTFARVKFADVYPGVDVVHYGVGQSLEYDIVVAPGADASQIRLAVEGNAKTAIDASGNLQIVTAAGVVVMHKPSVYQLGASGVATPVGGEFVLAKDDIVENRIQRRDVRFQLAAYDHSRELVIDPASAILIYSSYLGGSASSTGPVNLEQFSGVTANTPLTVADLGLDVALDSSNNAYVTGVAYSKDFPTTPGAFQTILKGANAPPKQNPNVFVAKFDTSMANNASLVYATYLGGAGDAVDKGKGDGDLGFGIAVDAAGQAFVVGQTYSSGSDTTTGFPGTSLCGPFGQTNNQGAPSTNVGFISKLNSAGTGVVWSCYIDGSENATESRVALFPAGCGANGNPQCKAYMSGSTQSTIAQGFPGTANRFQTDLRTAATNMKSNATFIVVHEDGKSLDYATHYGGTGNGSGPNPAPNADAGISVAVDASGHGYIVGATFSKDLTLVNEAVSYPGRMDQSTSNVFVAEFDPTLSGGASLIYATYLGGTGATGTLTGPFPFSLSVGDVGTGIAVDSETPPNIFVTGLTASTNFQTTGNAYSTVNLAGTRAICMPDSTPNPPATAVFVTRLDPSKAMLSQIIYSTYFGGCGIKLTVPLDSGSIGFGEAATDIKEIGDKVYLTGTTASGTKAGHDFPLSPNALACSSKYRLDDNQSAGIGFMGAAHIVPLTAFATELDTGLSGTNGLIFSMLLGGTGNADIGGGLAVDSSKDMVVTGLTYSADLPITPNAFQFANRASGSTNAFLTVINPTGSICSTPFATATPTPTATATNSPSPTASATSSGSPTPTATTTATATSTSSGSPTATATATATRTATATATSTGSRTPTATATATSTATVTATPTATATPSAGRISVSTNPIILKGKPGHPKSKKLKVKNIGAGPLDVTGTAGLSAPLSSSGGGMLAPKKSLTITVTDSPTTGGSTVSQTLKILSNDPTKREVDITVTGTSP